MPLSIPDSIAPTSTSLSSLIQLARSGEEAAFRTLYARTHAPLLRHVRLRLGAELGRHLEAEDIVQETFLSAFVALERHEFRSDAAFQAWLGRIADRKLQDAVRFFRREKRTPRSDYFGANETPGTFEAHAAEPATTAEDPLESLGQRELGRVAARCLGRLAPEARAVVVWREMLDEPWHRIAERLGCRTIGATRHLHGVACDQLARFVKRELASGGHGR